MDSNGLMVVLADIAVTKAFGDITNFRNESVAIDKKSIIVGNHANWRIKWKDVESYEVDDTTHWIWLHMSEACDVRKLTCKIRESHKWTIARDYVEKRWKKLHQKREEEEHWEAKASSSSSTRAFPTKSTVPFGRQRRGVYGRNQMRAVPFKPLTLQSNQKKTIVRKRQVDYLYEESDNDDEQETPHDDNLSGNEQPMEQDEDEHSDAREEEEEEQQQVDQSSKEQETQIDDSDDEPRSRRPRRLRKKQLRVRTERMDSSDDEDPFSPAPLTTPASQRVVSPTDVLGEKVEEDGETQNQPTKPVSTKGTISNFFAPRPKSTSSTESTADKVLKSHSKLGSKKNDSPTFEGGSSIKAIGTKSLAPLKRDNDWLSQTPALSPIKLNTTPSPMSPQRVDMYASPPSKRNLETVDDIDDYPETTTPVGKRLKFRSLKSGYRDGRRFGRLSNDYLNDLESETTKGSDETTNDLTETRATRSSTSPRSNWKGLRNMGNTCYLNASLQMLFSVGNFVSALASGWGGDLTKSIVTVSNSLKGSSPYARSPDAKPVKLAIDKVTDKFTGYLQRDAHEFLSDLIDQVHSELEAKRKKPAEANASPECATQSSDGDHASEDQTVSDGTGTKDMSIVGSPATDTTPSDASPGVNATMSVEGEPSQGTAASGEPMAVEEDTILPTDEFFRLNLQVRLACTCCGYTRSKEELYRHLSLDIAGPTDGDDGDDTAAVAGNIQASLERFFQPEELEIKCEKCETGDRAIQTLRILSQPKALLLHLKRFVVVEERHQSEPDSADSTSMQTDDKPSPQYSLTFQKNKSRVEIPERLTLDSFRLEPQSTDPHYYDLKSVVHHIGNTASSGHYTAHGLRSRPSTDSEKAETWVSFDDGATKETTVEEVVSSIRSQRTAYMLLYACGE